MTRHIRTKMICTIGPSVSTYEKILELIQAGMNVARLNFSHGTHEQHGKLIELLKKAREELKKPLAIMLDSKGPEIRIKTYNEAPVSVKKGTRIKLIKEVPSASDEIKVYPEHVVDEMSMGMTLLFDDGYFDGKIVEKTASSVIVEIHNPGLLKNEKKINIPHGEISLPSMTEEDIKDFEFGCQHDIDMIAVSFVRSAENILEIRKLLKQFGKKDIQLIAKIENVLGVKNFDSILQVADGIMVARGDLGVELPLNQVPQLQKMMIKKCNLEGKLVVTATQMLESMMHYPRPTRAEVSDVANAIYDSTSCVMLSGETAAGNYPVETGSMMRTIVEEAEKDFDYETYDKVYNSRNYRDTSSAVAIATVKTAYKSEAKAIFTYTSSGFTSRLLSKFRPKIPIISLTKSKKIFHQLSSYWGVIPVYVEYTTPEEAFDAAACYALREGYVHYGDMVLVTAGSPFGVRGTTNMMMIKNIGDVLVRGIHSPGHAVYAQCLFSVVFDNSVDMKGKIILITHYEAKYEPFLKEAAGIILQNLEEDQDSEEHALAMAKEHKIPIIVRAESASHLIKEGEWITLVPNRGLVFRGKVLKEEEMIKNICRGGDQSGCPR